MAGGFETAYEFALDRLEMGRLVIILPIRSPDGPRTYTLTMPLDDDTAPVALHPLMAVRGGFAVGTAVAAAVNLPSRGLVHAI